MAEPAKLQPLAVVRAGSLAMLTALCFVWALDLPIIWGVPILEEQFLLFAVGLGVAAAHLTPNAHMRVPLWAVVIAILGFATWAWGAWSYPGWIQDPAGRGVEKWVPAVIALVTLALAVHRLAGAAITVVMLAFAVYGVAGHVLPGILEANYTEARRLAIYLFTDSGGVPGVPLQVTASVVVAFLIFSRMLEASGAGQFFDDISMSILGHHRGGPGKVAVASSALFGIINGSSVANVVSSGVVTIPLMIRNGFRPAVAGAVEAVSSNAGQFTPPVMGATAFLIADFLQIPYTEVIIAAAIPAAIFYVVMFVQLDAYAAREGLKGVPRAELPFFWPTLLSGAIFLFPIFGLMLAMFLFGIKVEKAAIYAAGMMIVLGVLKSGRLDLKRLLHAVTVGAGEDALAILLVGAISGVVIGVLNLSGLGFLITLALAKAGAYAGIVGLLMVTAGIALVLGMGMPTAAVYVLLAVVLAPAMTKFGVPPLAAHLFIFYFGLLSMLTPPVAMASFAAATIARASLAETSVEGLKLGASTYLLPFVFVLNPALIGIGTWDQILLAVLTATIGGVLLGWGAAKSVISRPVGPGAALAIATLGAICSFATVIAQRDAAWSIGICGAALGMTALVARR